MTRTFRPTSSMRPNQARAEMIEACVELDDQAMDDYLNGKEIANETIKKLLRKAVLTGAFFPVLCGSAFKNKGVQPLLDAVVDYLPSPLDRPLDQGHRRQDRRGDDAPGRPTASRCRCWPSS